TLLASVLDTPQAPCADLVRELPDGGLRDPARGAASLLSGKDAVGVRDIEALMLRFPGVSEAVVIEQRLIPGKRVRVGYLTPGRALSLNAEKAARFVARLRTHLAASLSPEQMPLTFMVLESMPLAVDGSIALEALPMPDAEDVQAPEAPEGGVERAIATLWEELLGREQVGRHDTFF
ncbi:hypothetical protein JY420_20460, partial [Stenotrophomonas maltophilia]|nr:hypothetical protein [Stenotrophomonas maltophilia]MBN5136546.1 hypothetical protein [Stenotrophomonas maltophilia]